MSLGDKGAHELADLLQASHLIVPDDVPALILEHASGLGADDAALYLVNYEQLLLVPVPRPGGPQRREVMIDSTLAGRCYRTLEIQRTTGDDEGTRVWVPVLDGVERLGVLELTFRLQQPNLDEVAALAGHVAEVVMTKQAYGDLSSGSGAQPMSIAAELAWNLLPPLTFGTNRLVISGVLAPVYDLGGDSFDYAVDAHTARIAIFDAMGHVLEAGLLASVAVAASSQQPPSRKRSGRLGGGHRPRRQRPVRTRPVRHRGNGRPGTGIWSAAMGGSGPSPPLLLRNGRVVKTLVGEIAPPLGIGGAVAVAVEMLEPADQVLFFTDGVVEARSADGTFSGVDRLVEMITRTSASATPAPETMRRLLHAILDHQEGELQDDATIVVVEWRGPGSELLDLALAPVRCFRARRCSSLGYG